MPAEKVTVTANAQLQILEVLDQDVVPSAASETDRQIYHNGGGLQKTFLATDTPHGTACLDLSLTFDGDEYVEINLRAAPTTGAPDAGEDLAGKRLMAIEVVTPSGNADVVLIKGADTNGYHPWGNTFVQAFPAFTNQVSVYRGQALPAIAADARILRFEGAEGDSVNVKLVFEDVA